MTLSYTKNLHLAVPDFLTEPWHGEFAQAMDSIDRIIYSSLIAANTTVWVTGHHYAIGDLIIDPATGGIFSSAEDHTSSSATFAQEVATFPSRWTSFAPTLATQAEAEAGTDNTKYMSPLRVAQAIDIQVANAIVASQAEALGGTDNTKMMTPLRTSEVISARMRAIPEGRLTLTSGKPIMTTPVINSAFIYYTPYIGTNVPIWDGTAFEVVDTWDELVANATQAPAVGSTAAVDWFVHKGTPTTVTITIGTPTVINYTAHGLRAGQPIQFTTDGTLPSGIAANTTYYVMSAGFATDSFQIEVVRGSAVAVNTTGSQAGIHTVHARILVHGPDWTDHATRATPITNIRGIWTNGAAIGSVPINQATYVGSTVSPGGGLMSWRPAATLAAEPCLLLVYNAYNKVQVVGIKQDPNGGGWAGNFGIVRNSNGSIANRLFMMDGLGDIFARVQFCQLIYTSADAVGQISFSLGRASGTAPVGVTRVGTNGAGILGYSTVPAEIVPNPSVGAYFIQATEYGLGTQVTFYGGPYYSFSTACQM